MKDMGLHSFSKCLLCFTPYRWYLYAFTADKNVQLIQAGLGIARCYNIFIVLG